jgi:hypothetical protein
VLLAVTLHALAVSAAGGENRDLINFLLQQNEQARQQALTVKYEFSESVRQLKPSAEYTSTVTGSVKQRGRSRWSEHTAATNVIHKQEQQTSTIRTVISQDYYANWIKGTLNANLRRHAGIENMREDEKLRYSVLAAPDVLLWGFGLGGETWREAYEKHRDVNRWDVQEVALPAGGSAYQIKRYTPYTNDRGQPDLEFLVEPDRGFLITQLTAYTRTGEVALEVKVGVSRISGGHWFPEDVDYKAYAAPQQGQERVVEMTRAVRLSEVEVDPKIPDEQFTWQSLGLTDGTHLIERSVTGEASSFVCLNGKLVPLEIMRSFESGLRDSRVSLQAEPAKPPNAGSKAGVEPAIASRAARAVAVEPPEPVRGHSRTLLIAGGGAAAVIAVAAAIRWRFGLAGNKPRKEV